MRFVLHFVSVYSIIHPGVQRAANMPGTACDRVRQAWSEICMRHFSVETEKKKKSPEIPELLTGTLDEEAHSRQILKSVGKHEQTCSRHKWIMEETSGRG